MSPSMPIKKRVRQVKVSSKKYPSISRMKRLTRKLFPKRNKLRWRYTFEKSWERFNRRVRIAEEEHEAEVLKEWEGPWILNQKNVGLRDRTKYKSGLF